jgi:hypothetical protein
VKNAKLGLADVVRHFRDAHAAQFAGVMLAVKTSITHHDLHKSLASS